MNWKTLGRQSSSDPCLDAILEQLWLLYSDDKEVPIGLTTLTPPERQMIERIDAFLQSDRPYEWPVFSFRTGNLSWWCRVLGIGKRERESNRKRFFASGDIEAWPFLGPEECGLKNPPRG